MLSAVTVVLALLLGLNHSPSVPATRGESTKWPLVGGYPYDSHKVPFNQGPALPPALLHKRWRYLYYVDASQRKSWLFHREKKAASPKALYACVVSVSGPGHPQLRGLYRIRGNYLKPSWRPGPGSRRMHKKHKKHQRPLPPLPAVVPGGDPRNEKGLREWVICEPFLVHGTNDASVIGGYTLGCFQVGNADIDAMSHTDKHDGVDRGDCIYIAP